MSRLPKMSDAQYRAPLVLTMPNCPFCVCAGHQLLNLPPDANPNSKPDPNPHAVIHSIGPLTQVSNIYLNRFLR